MSRKVKTNKQEVNFIPAVGKYLVKVQDALTVTKGGILIAETAREKPMEGVILAVNETNLDREYTFKDLVLFGKYSGTEVVVDNEQYLILSEDDILGKRI